MTRVWSRLSPSGRGVARQFTSRQSAQAPARQRSSPHLTPRLGSHVMPRQVPFRRRSARFAISRQSCRRPSRHVAARLLSAVASRPGASALVATPHGKLRLGPSWQSGHRTVSLVPSAVVWARCGSAVTQWLVVPRHGTSCQRKARLGSYVVARRVASRRGMARLAESRQSRIGSSRLARLAVARQPIAE